MASTYSDRLKLELMATGANANTWGTNTNNNLDVIDAFSAGYLSKSVAGSSNITLTTANASDTAEASNKVIELTGALTGDIVVFIPAVESNYTFFNNTTGSQTLTIAATGHTANGVVITQGAKTTVYCDGASNYNVEIASSTDLGSQTGTLPQVSGANLTNLNASNVASGTLPDARFPATLPQVSGANLTDLAAGNVASGTLSSDRLPTVPTTKGGTGLTSIGTAGQVLTVNSGASGLEFAAAAGFGGYNLVVYNSPATYTPPADLESIKVTVIAGGGGGGGGNSGNKSGNGGGGGGTIEHIPAASMPGPVSVTVGSGGNGGNGVTGNGSAPNGTNGSTSSFGSFCSATGGSAGGGSVPGSDFGAPGAGGSGTGGDINMGGGRGGGGTNNERRAAGNGPFFGTGGNGGGTAIPAPPGDSGVGSGSGGGGGCRTNDSGQAGSPGGAGIDGIVIIEEYKS